VPRETTDAACTTVDLAHAQFAVRRAWSAVFGARSFAAGVTLHESGCDELLLLQFVQILERTLRRRIALDALDEVMRPADVARALLHQTPQPRPHDTRPLVFLFPGLDDDELRLASFRRALTDRINFVLIEYPDWPAMSRPGWRFADLVNAVVIQMVERSSDAPLLLAGYSFGGELAFAAARRAVALGYPVRWLGILDTDLTRVPQPLSGGIVERLRHYAAEIAHDVRHDRLHKIVGLSLAKLARQGFGLDNAARTASWWRSVLPLRTQFWFDRRTRSILRMRALWRWLDAVDPGTLDAPVGLFRSELGRGASPADLGWRARCPNLSIVQVPGDHHTLFDMPQRGMLAARFADAVECVSAKRLAVACAR